MIRRKTPSRITKTRPLDALAVVHDALRAYADRGVFRGFSQLRSSSEAAAYKFFWLTPNEMQLSVDVPGRRLRFDRLLPGLPADSALYVDLKQFLRDRHGNALPEHRRIDPQRALARTINRRAVVSIVLDIQGNEFAYGVNRTVNLVHELFVHLRDAWPEYLMEHFDAPQEQPRRALAIAAVAVLLQVDCLRADEPHQPYNAEAAKLKNPIASSRETIEKGKAIYRRHCASCHGVGGKGDGGQALSGGEPSDLTDDKWDTGSTDGEIFVAIRDGLSADMLAYKEKLKDDQMWSLVVFIRSLGPKLSKSK